MTVINDQPTARPASGQCRFAYSHCCAYETRQPAVARHVYQTLVRLLAGTFFDFALVRPSRLREHSGQSHIPLALRRSVQPVVRASIRLHSCDPQSNQAARPVWRCEESSHASSSAARVSPISMIFRPIGASLSCEECARCQKRGSCASDSCHKTVVSGKFALNVDAQFVRVPPLR